MIWQRGKSLVEEVYNLTSDILSDEKFGLTSQIRRSTVSIPSNREGDNLDIKAVLFDLDNTLLLFDERKFFEAYSQNLYLSFKDVLSMQEFAKRLIASTQVMTMNGGNQSNAECFIQEFSNGLAVNKDKIWQRFEKFYEEKFEQFEYLMSPLPNARNILEKIYKNNIKIIIASNPMFPANVQLFRLNWAGLEDFPFELITDATNSTYCKPNLNYYLEICRNINIEPQYCLMVGNDSLNDMIASKIGVKTMLTSDSPHHDIELSRELAKKMNLEIPQPDHKGKLIDVLTILNLTNHGNSFFPVFL
jgi:FMN phosphatase YigB (HAD superfamily)